MISYSQLGNPKNGRLGNSLFQIASTIGIALTNGTTAAFPKWSYARFFKNELPEVTGIYPSQREAGYHFTPFEIQGNTNVNGWLQSSKYWRGFEDQVKEALQFKPEIYKPIMEPNGKQTIAISVRRGDFVGNPNYYQLPIGYYIQALLEHFPNYHDYNIIFFSDDLPYCKVHFECLDNAYFPQGYSDIEQLALMTTCDHFIISNSTFSWWGAYLGTKEGTKVIRPLKNITGMLEKNNSERDYWEPTWTIYEHEGKRIDLEDMTFTIPVFYDHDNRKENLNLCIAMLQKNFNTKIIVGEQGGMAFGYTVRNCRYMSFKGLSVFHRTKMLNEMSNRSTTDYVVNYDADIITPPMQFVEALRLLKAGADFVYPYDGRFARVGRHTWLYRLQKENDIGIVGDYEFRGKHGKPLPISSVGGAVCVNKKSFEESGMENEKMISYAPEDCERWDRWHILGYDVRRVKGCVYHIDHWIGVNSSSRNPYFEAAHRLLDKMRLMTKDQMRAFVNTWPWISKK